jgi:hypothetical protein
MTNVIPPKSYTTIYEVNDENRGYETYGHTYEKSFVSFIESLGFDIKPQFEKSPSLGYMIQGVVFKVNTDNASYMSKNAYTRDVKPRKAQNRYIILTSGNTNVIKVHFNKELDAPKLKAKINQAIADYFEKEERITAIKKANDENTIAIAMHYLQGEHNLLKSALHQIHIQQGIITFYFKNLGSSIQVLPDNTLKAASFNVREMQTREQVVLMSETIHVSATIFAAVTNVILSTPAISPELQEWTKNQYHRYFYIETMSINY